MERMIVTDITQEKARELDVFSWATWGCGISEFDWTYGDSETAYILEGRVEVTFKDQTISFGPGQLVYFPAGLSCVWKVKEPVPKHYSFGLPAGFGV